MHIYNGFTWLLISLSCDFNATSERPPSAHDPLLQITEDYQLRQHKDVTRRKVHAFKNYVIHCLLLGLLLLSLFGTLNHKTGDSWCGVVYGAVIAASFLPLGVFGTAIYFYAERFWDPEVSKVVRPFLARPSSG
jgi:hypothetical protein